MEMFTERIPDLPGVPRAYLDLLREGMANDPAARPSAEELRDRLAALPMDDFGPARPVSGAPVSGGPSVYVSRSYPPVPPVSPPAPGDEHPTVPDAGRRARRRWWRGGLG
jgi:eukaryotic-like serine/threonine-protein kinase